MKQFKRFDEDTILVEGVYYSTNISKKTEILSSNGFKIDSIKINGIHYYPFKEEKNNQK
jgi:hypothetical protein